MVEKYYSPEGFAKDENCGFDIVNISLHFFLKDV